MISISNVMFAFKIVILFEMFSDETDIVCDRVAALFIGAALGLCQFLA